MGNLKVWIRSALFLLLALVTIGVGSTWGQGSTASSYVTYTTDGNYIYTTVVTEGQVIYSLEGMQHTYYAYNQLTNTATGLRTGGMDTQGPTANYVSVVNDQDMGPSGDQAVEFDYDSEVDCPIMGDFYNIGSDLTFTIALSSFWLQDQTASECTYFPSCTGTCTDDGRISSPNGWPLDVCPSFLFCAELVLHVYPSANVCLGGICKSKLYNSNICT